MNKYILLVMKWLNNKDSVTKEELKENYDAAYADVDAVYADAAAADYSYADDAAAVSVTAACCAASAADAGAEKWVNKYFERTGEDKQDYIDELNKEKTMKTVIDAVNEYEGVWPLLSGMNGILFNQASGNYSDWTKPTFEDMDKDNWVLACVEVQFHQCVDYMTNNFGTSTLGELNTWRLSLIKPIEEVKPVYTKEMHDNGESPTLGMNVIFEGCVVTIVGEALSGNLIFENEDGYVDSFSHVFSIKPLTSPKTDSEIAIDSIIDKTIKEMEICFELKTNHDDSLVSDDTQLGVEFATEFMRAKLIQLLEVK